MEYNIYLLLVGVFAVSGIIFFQMSCSMAGLTVEQQQTADMYRNLSFLSIAIAGGIIIYNYLYEQRKSANMCGGTHKAYMCGRGHY